MKSHLSNAAFGIVDYAAYPLGLLLLAPVVLRSLGLERFGIWAMANAVLNVGAIAASGFSDANTRSTAMALETENPEAVLDSVRCTLGIHVIFGSIVAVIVWLLAPEIAKSVTKGHTEFQSDCLLSLQITAVLVWIRAVETVCVSTQRAYARYGSAIQISVAARALSLIAAALIPLFRQAVAAVMLAALLINAGALGVQFHQIKRLLNVKQLMPSFHAETTWSLLRFGFFTWLQSATTLLFGQADRIFAGVVLGAAALSAYALSVQLAQPIYGLTAAGLHFLFPHLASRCASGSTSALRHFILRALAANIAFVLTALAVLIIFGRAILRVWGGPAIASAAGPLLPAIACSAALSALGVTGCYALMALGKPRFVTSITLTGGLAMLLLFPLLIRLYGLSGIVYGRLMFAPSVLLVYIPLFATVRPHNAQQGTTQLYSTYEGT
jgi:O-antigen/teichoic acid export membrane protein